MHVGERIHFVPAALRYGNKTETRADPVPGVADGILHIPGDGASDPGRKKDVEWEQ